MTGPETDPATATEEAPPATDAADAPVDGADAAPAPESDDTVDAAIDDAVADVTGSDKESELLADLQRVHAEYANYRRRAEREKVSAQQYGKGDLIKSLLPVLDDLDRARAHGDLEAGPLRAVADKITETLTAAGLASFGAEGDEFDPALHEAVQHEGQGSNPVIGTVYRQGFRLGDRVLRTAMVVVVDGPEPAVQTPTGQTDEE